MESRDLATAPPSQGLIRHHSQLPSSRFCSGCGRTLEELRRSSLVGCAVCYEAFRDILQASIVGLHGTAHHGQSAPPLARLERRLSAPAVALLPRGWLESLFGLNRLEWLSGGPDTDVAVSSRVRLARNLAAHAFPSTAAEPNRQEVFRRVERALQSARPDWVVLSMEDLDESGAALLRERHLLSPAMLAGTPGSGLASLKGGRESLMVNEEDHLRLQTLCPGLELKKTLRSVLSLAQILEESLGFARDGQLGYLTTCPSNLGSGLRASVLLHLPALAWFQALPEVARKVARSGGMTLRGLNGEESRLQCPFLQLSNQVTLGQSEQALTQRVATVASSLVAWERQARARLLEDHRETLEDTVWRSWGALRHARLMSAEEAVEQLSLLRLGVLTGLLSLRDGQAGAMRLLIGSGDGHLESAHGESLSPCQLEAARAAFLRREVAP